MNRTPFVKHSRSYVIPNGIFVKHPAAEIILLDDNITGSGEELYWDALKRVLPTNAFKRGHVYREGNELRWTHNATTVKVPLGDVALENLGLPNKPEGVMQWPEYMKGVLNATSTETERGIFRGVQFEPERIVATDRFRLHAINIDTPTSKPVVIHADAIQLFIKMGVQEYGFTPNGIWVSGDGWRGFAQTMDGVFPDYERVIPKEFLRPVVLPRGDWMKALQDAAKTATDNKAWLNTDGSIEHDYIRIEGAFSSPPVQTKWMLKDLTEALQHCAPNATGAMIELSGEETAAKVTGGTHWAVIMPLRT